MKKVKIKTPIWNGKKVGIAERIIGSCEVEEEIEVEVMYKNSYGDRVFPYPYRITKEKARMYKTQQRYGTLLRIIPLKDMRELHYAI